jgi:hypothetical protein
MCALMKRMIKFEDGACPANLGTYGIDCNCPVNINKTDLDIELDVKLPQAPEYLFYFDYLSYLSIFLLKIYIMVRCW